MDFSSKQRGQRPQESRSGKTLEVLTEDEVVEIAKEVKYDEVEKTLERGWFHKGEPDDTTDQNGDGSSDNDEEEDDGEHS